MVRKWTVPVASTLWRAAVILYAVRQAERRGKNIVGPTMIVVGMGKAQSGASGH